MASSKPYFLFYVAFIFFCSLFTCLDFFPTSSNRLDCFIIFRLVVPIFVDYLSSSLAHCLRLPFGILACLHFPFEAMYILLFLQPLDRFSYFLEYSLLVLVLLLKNMICLSCSPPIYKNRVLTVHSVFGSILKIRPRLELKVLDSVQFSGSSTLRIYFYFFKFF